MSLRDDITKLASANPELRKHLVPLLQRTAGALPQDPDNALKALKALVSKAKLPIKVDDPNTRTYPVDIPKGFDSLFKTLTIEVRWQNPTWARIGWSYDHPNGGNGYTIGSVVFDEQKNQWGWQLETTREHGYVGSPGDVPE